MKKFFKSKAAATLLVLCLLLGTAVPAFGAYVSVPWDVDMKNQNNYTLCYGTKRSTRDYILFANTSGPRINLWGAFYTSGYIVTDGVTLNAGEYQIKDYFKTNLINEPEPGDRLKARGELYSASGVHRSQGACCFE